MTRHGQKGPEMARNGQNLPGIKGTVAMTLATSFHKYKAMSDPQMATFSTLNKFITCFSRILNLPFFSQLLSRSAHQTPNYTNPEYIVCLLFEVFFKIKVLN